MNEFVENIRDWLIFLERALKGVGKDQITMLHLQELMSARQRAISLTAKMIAVLDAAAKQILANIAGDGRSTAAATSIIDQSDDDATDGASGDGGACVNCDGL